MGIALKQALQTGRVVTVAYLGQFCSPKMVEILGLTGGYDAVWLDQEHTSITLVDVENCCRAAKLSRLDCFVRLTATDYAAVMRPLEAGAGGVMAAQIRSAQETETFIQWAKFHPRGIRGANGTGVDGEYGRMPIADYMKRQNEEIFVAVQIENVSAVADVDQIAKVPELDLMFIGPVDLSQSMGLTGQWDHPRMWEAIERVAQAARTNGIHWAILPANVSIARRCVNLGCRMLSIGLDVSAVRRGWESFREEYREFMP